MIKVTYGIVFTAFLVTGAIGFKTVSKPVTAVGLGFILWAVSPYLYLAVLTKAARQKGASIAVLLVSVLAAVFGIGALVDAMFIHLDAQSGLVIVFAPLWQWVFLLVVTLPLYILNRVKTG